MDTGISIVLFLIILIYADDGTIQAETFRAGWHNEVPEKPLNLAELQAYSSV